MKIQAIKNAASGRGFTLVELIVAMGLFLLVFSFAFVNIGRLPSTYQQSASLGVLIADLKDQQTKAMSGETAGSGTDYGIYFGDSYYTLFQGSSYLADDPLNFTVNLENYLTFSAISFPQSMVVFRQGSGEVADFTEGSDSFSLTNSQTGRTTTLKINRYGVIYTEE